MRWCSACVLPDTRPNLEFGDDGVCNACRLSETKRDVDWPERRRRFEEIVRDAKSRRAAYDCVVPVSGGKDSTWQVVTCLDYGLRPLAVSWKPPARTEIGARNLANLIDLGVDHIDFRVNPNVEKRFMSLTFERAGDPAIPMHLAIFNFPLTVAVRFRVPLVVWGENSALEYGGTSKDAWSLRMDAGWVRRFGATHGTGARDWAGEGLTLDDLTPYAGPGDVELEESGVQAVFLGSLLGWDPESSLAVASAHGFRRRPEGPKTGYYDYADIDDDFIAIHHYLKWYKFGFTRLFDNLALEIRAGRMSRDKAIAIIRARGDERPDDDIDRFCEFVGITSAKFDEIAGRFRNTDVWTHRDGVWAIDGFLVGDWEWR